jgi:hypothetical protein
LNHFSRGAAITAPPAHALGDPPKARCGFAGFPQFRNSAFPQLLSQKDMVSGQRLLAGKALTEMRTAQLLNRLFSLALHTVERLFGTA